MRVLRLVCWLGICAAPLAAQQSDRGVFTIQRGEKPLGREEFSVAPGADGGSKGWTLASLARYPAAAPTVQIQAMVERNAAGAVTALQVDTRAPGGISRVYGAATKDNLTIRQSTSAAESVREFPRSAGIVILDDSLFALYQVVAEAATASGARFPVLYPRSGRRGQVTAVRSSPTTIDMSGAVTGTLTVDPSGRLMRVVLANGVSAIRQSH
jgi:hypothetical protein